MKSPFVEEQLYQGFADATDYRYAHQMLAALPWDRAPFVPFLRDARLAENAVRLIFETSPPALDPATRSRLEGWMRERLLGPSDSPWRTVSAARQELDALRRAKPPIAAEKFEEIAAYLDVIEAAAIA
jgi:exonuclease I